MKTKQEKAEESKKKTGLAAFKEALAELPENKKFLAEKLLNRITFMDKTLNELQKKIKKDGAVYEAVNGNGFKCVSEHPAQKSYNTMIGKYSTAIKTLNDMLPEGAGLDDELMNFLKK